MSSKNELKTYIKLIQQVLDSVEGRDLIDKLENNYRVLFTDNTNEQYYRLGKHDLIQELKYYLNLSHKELKETIESESYNYNVDPFID